MSFMALLKNAFSICLLCSTFPKSVAAKKVFFSAFASRENPSLLNGKSFIDSLSAVNLDMKNAFLSLSKNNDKNHKLINHCG